MRIKTCKICGKRFDACRNPRIANGYFQWQEVACSPECAIQYMQRMDKDGNLPSEPKVQPEPEKPAQTTKPTKRSRKKTKASVSTAENEEVTTEP